uniref:Uncharacterized protein n=1 Tax=Klebsiella pneumoniae TaxID=573 RepID=A0A0U3AV58_KLEPN|nr:hypothetical protein [Klebsiella pneumoniae]
MKNKIIFNELHRKKPRKEKECVFFLSHEDETPMVDAIFMRSAPIS